jgi:hypothetical protein
MAELRYERWLCTTNSTRLSKTSKFPATSRVPGLVAEQDPPRMFDHDEMPINGH